MNKSKLFFCSLLFLTFFTLFSCATTSGSSESNSSDLSSQNLTAEQLCPAEFIWQEIEPGFWKTEFKVKSLGIKWMCVKIDLSNPKLRIVNGAAATKKGFRISSFAAKNNAVVTVNTTPFDVNNYLNIAGVVKNEGTIISNPVEAYCAIGFISGQNGYKALIIKNQTDEAISQVDSAAGGFFQILNNNEVDYNFNITRRSRSGAGINQEKNELYILVNTSGFNLRDRNGLSYPECALILQAMGCTQAMEFDGGHSTGLCIYKKQVMAPLFQRKIPVVLGFLTN